MCSDAMFPHRFTWSIASTEFQRLRAGSADTRSMPAAARRWPAQTRLAWPILGVRHFSDINRTLLLEAGAALSRAKGTAERLLEHLRSRAVQEAEALYAGVKPGPDPGFRTLAL